MTFTTTALVGDRVLVRGEDFLGTSGQVVLDSSQWAEVNRTKQFKEATKEFDAAVEEFFAPLTEAADKAKAKGQAPEQDPIEFVVLEEGENGTPGKPAHLVKLTKDSVVLRLIEENADTDRLAWVNDTLEILAASQAPSNVAVPTAAEVTEMGSEATGLPVEE